MNEKSTIIINSVLNTVDTNNSVTVWKKIKRFLKLLWEFLKKGVYVKILDVRFAWKKNLWNQVWATITGYLIKN